MVRKTVSVVAIVFGLILGGNFLSADEGMWLLNNLPMAQLKQNYNFVPTLEWVENVQKSSARLPNCSASFVSKEGLIMTNGHCAEDAVMALSTPARNLYKNGFYAPTLAGELKTNLNLRVLNHIRTSESGILAVQLQEDADRGLSCEPVSLYQGAVTHQYCYKVYNDIRLVFSSEKNTWFFGGDADNFEFPRYALDAAFLRAYENGKPANTPLHFTWSKSGTKEGELIFVSGHPGRTSRLFTSSALATERDVRAPFILDLARRRELTTKQFMLRGKEQWRLAESDLFSWQNTRKLYDGKVKGLQDNKLMHDKEFKEIETFTTVNAHHPELGKQLVEGRKLVEEAQEIQRALYPEMLLYVRGLGFDSKLYDYAVSLVSGNHEYVKLVLASRQDEPPLNLEYEEAKLRDSLSHLMEVTNPYSEYVFMLRNFGSGPNEMAHNLIYGTNLRSMNEHQRLVAGGKKAVDDSKDPMIQLAQLVSNSSNLYKEKWNQSLNMEKQGYAKIADVIFKHYGTTQYPDATFTLRLSFGTVRGYRDNDKNIPPMTTLGGAYRHSAEFGNTGDYKLPARWLARKSFVNLKTPLNFISDLDITGGNSGSPVFNKDLEIVGLVFDGNIHSLVSDYDYNYSSASRAVSVHSSGILEVLSKIYRADRLVKELTR